MAFFPKVKIVILGFIMATALLPRTVIFAQPVTVIRVAIEDNIYSLNIRIRGGYTIRDSKTNAVYYEGTDINATATTYPDGIIIGGIRCPAEKIRIEAKQLFGLSVNGRMFRDTIVLVRHPKGGLLVINSVNLEDYVKGILYHEVSHYWPPEILKAQAIVCRTYAVYQARERAGKDFDVTSDVLSQVYGGLTSERYRTNRAVEETRGKVLTYRGKILPAFFHASCGGSTEDASLLWNTSLPPLQGVRCDYCKDSPHYSWHAVLSMKEIEEKFADAGLPLKKIQNIAESGRDASGRVTDLMITSSREIRTMPAKDFRLYMGPNVIRSTRFNVRVVDSDAVFEGTGWGHGVGMCQWGGYFMAKEGKTYLDILSFYYPGTDISSL